MNYKSLIKYFLSNKFRSQITLALAVFFGIMLTTNLSLKIITRHNKTYPVPDFNGLTLVQAMELAEDNDFRIQVMDSVYNLMHRPGTVIEQEPKKGIKVKKNRRIFLVMNAINPEKVIMPNIVGVSLRQAIAILESNGLLTGHLRYVPDIATNNVLKQKYKGKEITAGAEITKGSHIDIVLGKSGGNELVISPKLIGLSFHEAEKKISRTYLNLGAVIYDKSVQTHNDSLNAVVFRQKPDPDDRQSIAMGSIVDIWLTLDNNEIEKSDKKNE